MKLLLQHRTGLLSLICALISLSGAGIMIWRTSQGLLWSYWTLVVLFFGWWSLFLLIKREDLSQQEQVGFLAKASLSGLLLGLAFPFSHLPTGFLALIAWVPFFQMVEAQMKRGWRLRQIYFYAFHTFILWNIIATYWVANSSLPAGLFAILVNSALMGIPLLLHLKVRGLMPRLKWIPFIAFWLSFEFMHFHWELNWPWLSLGNIWATAPSLVQWYNITGVLGGSLWILLVNSLAKDAWEAYRDDARALRYYLRLGLAVLLPILFSLYQYSSYEPRGSAVKIAVVQPNVEPFYAGPLIAAQPAAFRQKLTELGRQTADAETQYIVYPEATLDLLNQDRLNTAPAIVELRERLLQNSPQASIIIGADTYRFLGQDEPRSRYTRTQDNEGEKAYFEIYNVALQIKSDRTEIDTYKKSKLVPGAELFPYPGLLRFLKPLVEQLGGTMAGRGAQRERSNFQKDSLQVAPAICYESVFGEHLAQHVQNGAQAIFIITNDAWWDRTAGHIQHFHYARLRALENRRPVARAANTGISGFINQRGDVLTHSQYNETTSLSNDLLFNDQLTYYSRNPRLIARFALFAAITFFLNWIVRTLLPKGE
ncbi:MAG TPA: apolipoprotein N-acyltransferase [Saprospiraceae bacterium]|nr:apolipoprotein N-acyltransferase [Saprospiraceae bacterium]